MKFLEWIFKKENRSNHVQRVRLKLVDTDDCTDILEDNDVYYVGSKRHKWLITLKCTCGCSQTIYLNVLTKTNPCWRKTINRKKRFTVRPSIWRKVGCNSHFNIVNSLLFW